jgi:hypothetical protein
MTGHNIKAAHRVVTARLLSYIDTVKGQLIPDSAEFWERVEPKGAPAKT